MRPKLILLVEDNPDDEALALRAFKQNKIINEVVVVRDGVEALDYLFGTGKHLNRDIEIQPTVILLDLKLPRLDGLDVLRRVRADRRTRFVPVVMLTSSDEERGLVESYELGANSYIRKPVDFAQFSDSVRHLQLYWMVMNEPPPSGERMES